QDGRQGLRQEAFPGLRAPRPHREGHRDRELGHLVSAFEASQDLLNIYIEDARSHLEALDHALLSLEREGFDHEQVSAVLGPLHTLKGNSGMIGFTRVKDYVHRLEDVFVAIDERRLPLQPSLFDALFAGASALRDAVERACVEKGELRDLLPEKAALEALLAPAATAAPTQQLAKAAPKPAPPLASGKAAAPEQYVSARSSTVRVDFAQLDQLLNLVGELIIYRTKLKELAHDAAEQAGGRGSAAHQLVEALQQVQGVSTQLQETVMDLRML